jgi:SAM-dependent methyltransferase
VAPPSDLHLRCALCDRTDLNDRRLRKLISEVYSSNGLGSRLRFVLGPADDRKERARWELAMALYAFDRLGVLSDDQHALVVGPGTGPAVRWLAWQGVRVRHLPDPANPLEFGDEDGSFGVIHCSGTIESLAGLNEARAASRELHRVLRPGGVAAISAGFRLAGTALGPPGLLLLDEAALRQTVLGEGLTWALTSPLDLRASTPLVESRGTYAWTSVHLLLVKPLFH